MPNIPQEEHQETTGYITLGDTSEFDNAVQALGQNIAEYDGIKRSTGNSLIGRTFLDFDTNISIRSEFNRSDYNYFRGNETVPKKDIDVIAMCMKAYDKIAIVHSVIDMMGDFTTQGMRIVHPNKKIENFHKNWAKIVNFDIVSERISNMTYRTANCPVKIRFGRVSSAIEADWRKSHATSDDIKLKDKKIPSRRIPLGYNILNPLTIEVIGGELAAFVGKPVYALKISTHFNMMMQRMERMSVQNEDLHDMIKVIPDNIRNLLKGGARLIPLDQEKIEMVHYKKDDWRVWAMPLTASILDNLIMLEKMHLADFSALDGAISQIRLWRLGLYNESNPAQSILPQPAAISKLRAILHNLGNGVLDLVWGPELDFKESSSQVHQYLKPEKYEQVMREIHSGLGVPATLTGSSKGSSQGMTNNMVAMKTLIERLEYGRKILTNFWNKQFKIIQKAMGWRFPAKVVFDYRVLGDEAATKAILIDMWDRNILATESLQELCDRDPELEELRIKREQRRIESGLIPAKAGPYHNAEKPHDLAKIALQGGIVAPSEIGLELKERKEGETTKQEDMEKIQLELEDKRGEQRKLQMQNKPTSPGGDGRPKNKTSTKPRKQRTPKPAKSGFNLFLWGNEAQKTIAELLQPAILKHFDKKNLRSLTKSEVGEAEKLKFKIFAQIEPYSDIDNKMVYSLLDDLKPLDSEIIEAMRGLSLSFVGTYDREPTLDEMRQMQSTAYALKHEPVNDEED